MISIIGKQSALDLSVKGSMGHFQVVDNGNASVRVEYLLTHIGLALEGDQEEAFLRHLQPVREVFPLQKLGFEEIMQRDIDDARVSTKLIPYLLGTASTGLVKLFPPIVVAVIPTDTDGLPADHYPRVDDLTPVEEQDHQWRVVRSGDFGKEAFELRQLIVDGVPQGHDYAQLRINTKKCRLAIVDGQHRAMALIALYRNKKGWPEKTRGIEPYYKRWSASEIANYDLSALRLPVMLCVFPGLDGSATESMSVSQACRSVFLALNRNAKKVSRARNYLLDDRDLIATFMRETLSMVKDVDAASARALRIWNVELDAEEDRTALISATAVTGVMHLYSAIERLMLADPPGAGLGVRKQNLWLKNNVDLCLDRLGVRDKLSSQAQASARRVNCDRQTEAVLSEAFRTRYGVVLVRALDEFGPYHANARACLELETKLKVSATGDAYHTILFDGQSMDRIFSDYLEALTDELQEIRDSGETVPPELEALKSEFSTREDELARTLQALGQRRLEMWLDGSTRKAQQWLGSESIRKALAEVYSHTFITSAFQSALLLTFFAAIESVQRDRQKPPMDLPPYTPEETAKLFGEYIACVNRFCVPTDEHGLQALLETMVGPVTTDDGASIVASSSALRSLLIPGELKPDEWPKFRCILLELWRPSDEEVTKHVKSSRQQCRVQLAVNYYKRRLNDFAKDHGVLVTSIKGSERIELKRGCAATVTAALRWVGCRVEEATVEGWLPADPQEAVDGGNDGENGSDSDPQVT